MEQSKIIDTLETYQDPVSPLLFNLAVDALAGILDKAKLAGHLKGVVSHLIPDGGLPTCSMRMTP